MLAEVGTLCLIESRFRARAATFCTLMGNAHLVGIDVQVPVAERRREDPRSGEVFPFPLSSLIEKGALLGEDCVLADEYAA